MLVIVNIYALVLYVSWKLFRIADLNASNIIESFIPVARICTIAYPIFNSKAENQNLFLEENYCHIRVQHGQNHKNQDVTY